MGSSLEGGVGIETTYVGEWRVQKLFDIHKLACSNYDQL